MIKLKRQVESPLEFYARQQQEHTERERKLAQVVVLVTGRTETPSEAHLPSHREAPLLFMDDHLRMGYPFIGYGVSGTKPGLRPGDPAMRADACATVIVAPGRRLGKAQKRRTRRVDQGAVSRN